MALEYEVKVLDIDENDIIEKLEKIGAELIEDNLMKRWVFVEDGKADEWIRLRENGDKITITYKKKSGHGIDETEEIEVNVDDFEKTAEIFNKLKFKERKYQENRRKFYRLGDIEFCIDSWPKIPTYLEVESYNEQKVLEGLSLLGLEGMDSGNMSVISVYEKYGIDLHSYDILKF
ncbi:MAG: class IV adenylate cyclase [Candidatus Gracilibacteria bacterium]|nr:class IV adenylate cyclase [Candidatus Gracilibacteria bacterium]